MTSLSSRADLPWIYQPKIQAILVFLWILMEKMVAHVYFVTLLYTPGMPSWLPLTIGVSVGFLGCVMVWKGIHTTGNEVRESWYGFMGGSFLWTGFLEMWHHLMGKYNAQPVIMKNGEAAFIPSFDPMLGPEGGIYPFFMGEHAYLQSTSMMCLILFFLMFTNKDVRCRMLMWFRRILKMRVGMPTKTMKPQYTRVAATEYIFVNWFMYVVMLAVLDERTFGLNHPVNYVVSAGVTLWAAYIIWCQTKQRETGLTIRYAIATVGVFWYIPEMTTLWGWYKEPWVNFYNGSPEHNINALLMLAIITAYIWLSVKYFKTPINPKSGRSW
ncbi:hypothetical protein QGN29_04015 [Temperatibacter marinus]|uniref:Uncharacterized protein n=1 Tax=Temperatibacter marinus TaxID=1456591 RepID=A0AA52EJ91_9PROT|nr:hypothetical protein [Temperatibacter marinus]WND03537.1 hypothetical protein QGN29_04015 [Temperatibacter marinus]